MEGISRSKLDQIESDLGEDDKGIWISYLIPNYEITETMMDDIDNLGGIPNLMFHDWFYVSVDPNKFESDGFFYAEDESHKMRYQGNSYNVDNIESVDHTVHYQNSVDVDDELNREFSSWLKNACDEVGVNYDELKNRLKSRVLPDLIERGDKAIIRATLYKQRLPP